MTLVELLVVIVLVTILVTSAIPVLSPGGDARKLREASRAINTYLAGAQARAVETGRPCGVNLRRLSLQTQNWRDNGVVTSLNYVEVPPPYTGFDDRSVARIGVLEAGVGVNAIRQIALQLLTYVDSAPIAAANADGDAADGLPHGYDADLLPNSLLRVGDRVVVGGATYELVDPVQYYGRIYSGSGDDPQSANWGLSINAYEPVQEDGSFRGRGPQAQGGRPLTFAVRAIDAGDPAGRVFATSTQGAGKPLVTPTLRLTHDDAGQEIGSPESLASIEDENAPQSFWTTPLPYEIYRQPTPATGAPLELPSGTAIDLQASRVMGGDASAQLYWQPDTSQLSFLANTIQPSQESIQVLFAPDGSLHRVYGADGVDDSGILSGSLALCVGRRELSPAEPVGGETVGDYAQPIDPVAALRDLPEAEADEVREKYNWLRPDTRWVVIGGRSGSIATVANASIDTSLATSTRLDRDGDGALQLHEQLDAALENAYARAKVGGR